MIENPFPDNWRDLQTNVRNIFNEIGLNAEQEKKVVTPRGEISLDVYAIDPGSVDKIKYIVECKNWKNPVPQSVVHSFSTVMQEVGANIGFIVSKNGLQSGAESYTQNTNIIGLSYLDFQKRYLEIWLKKYFIPKIGTVSDSLCNYTEPLNSFRDRNVDKLSPKNKKHFFDLYKKYNVFGMTINFLFPKYIDVAEHLKIIDIIKIKDLDETKRILVSSLGQLKEFKANYFRDFLKEIVALVKKVTDEFNDVFDEDIFAQHLNPADPKIRAAD